MLLLANSGLPLQYIVHLRALQLRMTTAGSYNIHYMYQLGEVLSEIIIN